MPNGEIMPNILWETHQSSDRGGGVDGFPGDSDSDSDPPESTPTPTLRSRLRLRPSGVDSDSNSDSGIDSDHIWVKAIASKSKLYLVSPVFFSLWFSVRFY